MTLLKSIKISHVALLFLTNQIDPKAFIFLKQKVLRLAYHYDRIKLMINENSTSQARRMNKIIKDAFLSLLETKPLDKITKNAICEKADIGHTTFYRYFMDKYHIASEITMDITNEYLQIVERALPKNYELYLTETFDFLNSNLKLLKLLYQNSTNYYSLSNDILNNIHEHYKKNDQTNTWFIELFHFAILLMPLFDEQILVSKDGFYNFLRGSFLKTNSYFLDITEDKLLEFFRDNSN